MQNHQCKPLGKFQLIPLVLMLLLQGCLSPSQRGASETGREQCAELANTGYQDIKAMQDLLKSHGKIATGTAKQLRHSAEALCVSIAQ